MKTVARIMAIITVMAGVLSFCAARAADPPAADRGPELCFELADGTVITGRLDAKTIAIRISSGNVLKVPVTALKELTVGLNDRPGFVPRVDALFKALDSDETHEAAKRELIALGPAAEPILKRHITGNYVWPAVRQILNAYKTWSRDHPDASQALARPIEPRSKIRTDTNTFSGSVAVDQFRIASPFGQVTVKLNDVLRIRPGLRAAPGGAGSWTVTLHDGSYLMGPVISQSLRVKSRYGTMVVPLARIEKASFGPAGKSVRARCWGSDRIVGALDPKTIVSLKTNKGRVDLSAGKIAMATHEPFVFKGHSGTVYSVAFSPDGKFLASGSGDNSVKLWDTATGTELLTFKGHSESVCSVGFSPDGKSLASGSLDKTVKLWDIAGRKELLTLNANAGYAHCPVFSPDGKSLASGHTAGIIKLWDTATGKELLALKGHSDVVRSVAFSPDGKLLASGSQDQTVKLWDTTAGKELRTLGNYAGCVHSVAFSPDGKTLAVGSFDKVIKIWDTVGGKELLVLQGHSQSLCSVSFSPDGKSLASGSLDKTVKLWDVATGKELLTLKGHSDYVYSVAFSPNGKRLASGSGDRTIKIWDVSDWANIQK